MEKSELVNWLQEEYQQWEVLLDRIGPARMEQPGVAAHWSMKDIVAHLTGRRVGCPPVHPEPICDWLNLHANTPQLPCPAL